MKNSYQNEEKFLLKMLKLFKLYNNRRISQKTRQLSSLYITGDQAQKNYVLLKPHIDFDEKIQNKSLLLDNIKMRNLNIDLEKISNRWEFFKNISNKMETLETTRIEIGKMIAHLLEENSEKNSKEIERLKLHSKLVKRDLKNIRDFSYGIEKDAALGVLSLPNELHEKTPLIETELYNYQNKPTHQSKSHMEIGKNLIEYYKPFFYYLKSDASLFEMAILNYCQSFMIDEKFNQFSNADFCSSIVIEGCDGVSSNINNIPVLEEREESNDKIIRLHMPGGASLHSFMAYFTKNQIQSSYLPLKCFSIGRQYKIADELDESLLNVNQKSVVQFFIVTSDDNKLLDEQFEKMIERTICLYKNLNYHFRLVYVPANQLKYNESLKISIQMYSNYLEKYVEVGYLSSYGNYLSKRLLFKYNFDGKNYFTKIIAGNLFNVQNYLACALENNCGNLLLCNFLNRFI